MQSIEENKRTALTFASGYLRTWNREPSAARLTPQEREVGARALNSMKSGRHYLQGCHRLGGSLEHMAAQTGLPLYVIAEKYSDAVRDLASYASSLLEACCKFCRSEMPDVIFDVSLRCPMCRASLQDHGKPLPNALDVQELKANCASLEVSWTAPTLVIEDQFEKRLKLWNWSIKLATDHGNRDLQSEALRQKDEEAWKFIKSFHEKYGH